MTKKYLLKAPAKINLHLEILGIRPDGYHEVAMVMQSVDLADEIVISSISRRDIVLRCDREDLPVDNTNLAYRAAELMQKEFPEAAAKYGGVEIELRKRIPMAAGLAGGSGNAAAVLVGIDLLWELGLTQSELQEIGAKLGSDVPFCISGGTAIATGRGESLASIATVEDMWVVLGKYRSIEVSTPWAYGTYRTTYEDNYHPPEQFSASAGNLHAGALVRAIAEGDRLCIGRLLYNDLAKVVLPAYPPVAELCRAFAETETIGALMSGSGPTVFALALSPETAEAIYNSVRNRYPDPDLELFIARFCATGVSPSSLVG
jgi:4-diphosphocytidyl-2-C-methyl-D-erythritol kinase